MVRTISFACALALAGCAERGVMLQQPVGSTTARVTAAPASTAPPPAGPSPLADAANGAGGADGADGAGGAGGADGADGGAGGAARPGATTDPCAEPPVIAFSGSSTLVTETQSAELLRLAECLKVAPNDDTTVVLIGYTDLMGTVPANIELGLTRAQAVMKQLMTGGVPAGRIVVASAGELQRPSARLGLHAPRVEILIARGGPSRPNEAPIARGIDAEGLVRRPPTKAVSTSPSPSPAPNRRANAAPARNR